MLKLVFLGTFLVTSTFAFFGDDGGSDQLFKKYAMNKIFEDCYGKDAVRVWWSEVRAACAKCQGLESPPIQLPSVDQLPASPAVRPPTPQPYPNAQTFPFQQNIQIPLSVLLAAAQQQSQIGGNFMPQPYAQQSYGPQAYSNFAPLAQHGFGQQQQPMLNAFYHASAHRHARDMADKPSEKFLLLKQRLEAKIGNMTCMMKELQFLKDDLQPNYEAMHERIQKLPVFQELKDDLHEGLDTCKDFSSCVPTKKFESSPLVKDLAQPMLLFKCFKGKKLMACMKKDLREKLGTGVDDAGLMARNGLASLENQASTSPEVLSNDIFNFVYGFDLSSSNDMF